MLRAMNNTDTVTVPRRLLVELASRPDVVPPLLALIQASIKRSIRESPDIRGTFCL